MKKWLFLTLFLFPPKKKEEEKENEVVKPVLKFFFQDRFDIHRLIHNVNYLLNLMFFTCDAFLDLPGSDGVGLKFNS